MSKRVIILGAKGRFGRAAVKAFLDTGWQVRAFARNASADQFPKSVDLWRGDAFEKQDIIKAAGDCDVIINALNPPYENWANDIPIFTQNVIAAAKASGAMIVIPGNVYNFGENMPAKLTEETPQIPTTPKGQMRVVMENTYKAAAKDGVRTLILRAGDFIEREKSGNWFDSQIAVKSLQGKTTYPGPLDQIHAWAYLPDMARACAKLVEKRDALAAFEDVLFPGFNVTGFELVKTIETVSGRKQKIGKTPWPIVSLLALFSPNLREVKAMRYLWNVPHAIEGAKFRRMLPEFELTPIETAIADAIALEKRAQIVTKTSPTPFIPTRDGHRQVGTQL